MSSVFLIADAGSLSPHFRRRKWRRCAVFTVRVWKTGCRGSSSVPRNGCWNWNRSLRPMSPGGFMRPAEVSWNLTVTSFPCLSWRNATELNFFQTVNLKTLPLQTVHGLCRRTTDAGSERSMRSMPRDFMRMMFPGYSVRRSSGFQRAKARNICWTGPLRRIRPKWSFLFL